LVPLRRPRARPARGAPGARGAPDAAPDRRPRPAGLPQEPVTLPALVAADLGPAVRAAFTRAPGNLSRTVGDQDGVLDRRCALAAWAGAPVAYAWQVHGRGVHVVTGAAEVPDDGPVARADGLVAVGPRVALGVL